MGQIPDGSLIAGGEWLKQLDVTGGEYDPAAPVEVSIRGRNIPAHERADKRGLFITRASGAACG